MKFLQERRSVNLGNPTRIYLAQASVLFGAFVLPVSARGADATTALFDQSENASLTAQYDRESRVLHIGTPQSSLVSAPPASVTISRAADLVGIPMRISRAASHGVGGKHGSPLAVGTLPTSMPVSATALTSGFGMRTHPLSGTLRPHRGLDLAAPMGSAIVATADGVVSKADWNGGYGLYIALDHGRGIQTRYGHMSRLNVSSGDKVRKGEVIGFVGSTGRSTGPHLHYEVRVNGEAINPASLLRR